MDTKCEQCGIVYPSLASFSEGTSPLICNRCRQKTSSANEQSEMEACIGDETLGQMSVDEFLTSKGVCRFWSVAHLLGLTSGQCEEIGKTLKELERRGEDAWETIGVKRDANGWMVKIETFSSWYQAQ